MEELLEYKDIVIDYNNAKGFSCSILFNYYFAKMKNSLKILLPCILEGLWYFILCYTKFLPIYHLMTDKVNDLIISDKLVD